MNQTDPTAAVWIDGDPLMEAIAAAIWEHCERGGNSTVFDDPRNIAAVAAAVARTGRRHPVSLVTGPQTVTHNANEPAASAVVSPPTDRAAIAERLWQVAEHNIVAEWICCDPINPKHNLCVQGDATLRMVRALLVDDPKAAKPAAPLLDAVLAALPEPTDRAAVLSEAERAMLTYALDQAQERIWVDDGFTHEDQAALDSLRRLAVEAHDTGTQQPDTEAPTLPDRLEAALTERFTELGNPYSRMVVHEKGPDGWPATHPVGPAKVAEVLRELLADEPAPVAQQPAAEETDEERADREATERDHARGDHTYCGITCEIEMPTEHLRNFVIAKGYPGTGGALDELLRRARVEVAEQQAAAEAEQDDTVHACPGRWGGPNCRCFDAEPAPGEQQAAAADGEETPSRTVLLDLVRDFLDPDPCSFDHHGYCQAHGYLGGEPGSCPHGRARKLIPGIDEDTTP